MHPSTIINLCIYRFNNNPEPFRPSYTAAKDSNSSSRSSKYPNTNRNDEPEPKSRFMSRFLNKNKSTGLAPTDDDDFVPSSHGRRYSGNDDSLYTARREPAAYTTFKDRKARLARSKSTHGDEIIIDNQGRPSRVVTFVECAQFVIILNMTLALLPTKIRSRCAVLLG